jgi:hypothetical protein
MINRRRSRTTRLLVTLLVAFTVGCGAPSATPARDAERERGGSPSSSTTLLDLDGRSFDLWQTRDASAVTAIVFTRSDCPISNRYAPTVKKLHDAYRSRGVRFYLVYVDPKEEPKRIRRHLDEFEYPCPALRDPTHALVAATGATMTPEAIVYDSQRKIVYRGRIDDLFADLGQSRDEPTTHELADAIEATLSGQPVREPLTNAVGCPISDLK